MKTHTDGKIIVVKSNRSTTPQRPSLYYDPIDHKILWNGADTLKIRFATLNPSRNWLRFGAKL
jgi:hypothetical protein